MSSRRRLRPPIGRAFGNFLFLTYVAVKLLYFINVILQLLLLQLFFGNNPNYSVLQHGIWVIEGWSLSLVCFCRATPLSHCVGSSVCLSVRPPVRATLVRNYNLSTAAPAKDWKTKRQQCPCPIAGKTLRPCFFLYV